MILRSARQRQSRLLPLQSHPSRSTSPRPPLLLGCLRLSQTAVRLRPSPAKPRSDLCIPASVYPPEFRLLDNLYLPQRRPPLDLSPQPLLAFPCLPLFLL